MNVLCTNEALLLNHYFRVQAVNITWSEFVSAVLLNQHVNLMSRFKLPSVACLAVEYFSHIISQTARFSGKKIY